MATSNINIDASFFELSPDGVYDTFHELTFLAPDNIGGRDIIVQAEYPGYEVAAINNDVTYETSTMISGTPLMYLVEYFREIGMLYTDLVAMVEWATSPSTLSGTVEADIEYYNRDQYSSGQQFSYVTLTFGDSTVSGFNAVALQFISSEERLEDVDLRVNYLNFSGDYDYWGNPIASTSGTKTTLHTYSTFSNTISGSQSSIIDITFSGWVPWNAEFDVFSVLDNRRDGTPYNFLFESTTRSGGLTGTQMDLYSTYLDTRNFNTEVKSADLFISPLQSDVQLNTGMVNKFDFDLWACVVTSGTLVADVQLFPMYFDNFSLDIGEYMPASGTICVDLHDELYNVVTSGTYFMVDDVPVSGTLTPISDGYRICYNPVDDFESLLGPTKFTARGENDNGDVITRDFYVTFGYVVEYDNDKVGGINYGYGNKIGVRVAASNLMNCPIDDADGFWFVSKDFANADLSAFIVGKPIATETIDLGASIYPWTTTYFYDKIFRMELTVKDFAGNEMDPFVLVFKVENLSEED